MVICHFSKTGRYILHRILKEYEAELSEEEWALIQRVRNEEEIEKTATPAFSSTALEKRAAGNG